jgi:hypothetical protein
VAQCVGPEFKPQHQKKKKRSSSSSSGGGGGKLETVQALLTGEKKKNRIQGVRMKNVLL